MHTNRSVLHQMKDPREHIIDTASKLFLQKGFKEVTIRELVESAGVSKGAFYHYFTSKEQIFEEMVTDFFSSLIIADFDELSTTSLFDFYKNWVQKATASKIKLASIIQERSGISGNHYYLIFDGLRMIPAFKERFDKEQQRELTSWIKIIDIAKSSNEISTNLSSSQIAKIFIYSSDGLSINLVMQNKLTDLHVESGKIWDDIYLLLKKR